MPIVSGGTPKIEIQIDGKVDDLLKDLNRVEKELDDFIAANRKAEQASRLTPESAMSSWTEFRSMYSTVLDVVRVGQQVWAATGQEYVNYVQQVEKVSRVTGMQMEDASRLIQVADDLRISQESLTRSLVFAAKTQNLSVDSIADLADQYNSLGTAQEKAEFASKKFGRNYAEITKLLEAGGATIRQMAADVQDFQIADEFDKQRVIEYTRALDTMNEAWDKIALTIGEKVVPWVTRFMIAATHSNEIAKEQERLMAAGMTWNEANKQAIINVTDALYGQSDALGEGGDAWTGYGEDAEAATKAAEEAAKRLSQTLQGMLSNMFAIQSQNDNYVKSLESLDQEETQLLEDKKRAEYEASLYVTQSRMNELQNKKKLNESERQELQQTMGAYWQLLSEASEVDQKLADNAQKRLELAEDQKKADAKRLYDMVQQKLAADGLIDTKEFEYLQQLAVQKGLVSKAAADQAIEENRLADTMVASFQKVQGPMQTDLNLLQNIAAYDGRVFQVGLQYTSNSSSVWSSPVPGALSGPNPQAAPGGYAWPYNMDSGGWGMPGQSYLIGTGAQPELFTPSQPGQFTPADKLGNTINITVGTISNMGDLDYLAQEINRRISR